MRNWGLVAIVAAMTISNAAQATGGSPVFAGLVDSGEAGDASAVPVDQPGIRLTSTLRLHVEMSDRISAIVNGISPNKTALIDIRKHRRMGMMVDYFPAGGGGFFLSAGWRKSPARARWAPGSASTIQIFSPNVSQPLRVATNIARRSPAMMAGWSGVIGTAATIGFSAGAMQEQARSIRTATAGLGQFGNTTSFSRVGGLAQVNFAWKF